MVLFIIVTYPRTGSPNKNGSIVKTEWIQLFGSLNPELNQNQSNNLNLLPLQQQRPFSVPLFLQTRGQGSLAASCAIKTTLHQPKQCLGLQVQGSNPELPA